MSCVFILAVSLSRVYLLIKILAHVMCAILTASNDDMEILGYTVMRCKWKNILSLWSDRRHIYFALHYCVYIKFVAPERHTLFHLPCVLDICVLHILSLWSDKCCIYFALHYDVNNIVAVERQNNTYSYSHFVYFFSL